MICSGSCCLQQNRQQRPPRGIVDCERVSGGPAGRRTMAMYLVDAGNSKGEGRRSYVGAWRELGFLAASGRDQEEALGADFF
ncbi:hypothetical protein LXL04_021108 [Taraxacum kok-saghyz]